MIYVEVSKALYDYDARTEDELSFKEDDILYVIEKEDEDWWRVELKESNVDTQGPIGLVPSSYLEEIAPIGKVIAEFDYEAQQEEELSFEEGDEMTLLETDDPDWYLVKKKNGQIGLAPSNYVQLAEEHASATTQIQSQAPPPPPVTISASIPAPPVLNQSIPPPPLQPILSQRTGPISTSPREPINDDAQSWNVHEYDAAKKKKKKDKGSLFVGNGMLCYGSETDKSLPVQQYPILDVTKYLYDGKALHIEISGLKSAVLDLQASSKSEAKAILAKIADSTKAAQMSNIQLQTPAPPPQTIALPPRSVPQPVEPESEPEEEESNCVPKWGISIYSFTAEGGDELTVAENEQLYVLDYERTDGWWRVQNVGGDTGLVPSSYIQFDDDETAEVEKSQIDNVRSNRQEEERALQQQRLAEEQARREQEEAAAAAARRRQEEESRRRQEEESRRRQEEESRRRQEEESRRRQEEESRRRQEEESRRRQEEEESRRREQEKRREEQERRESEAARQRQIEEDYRRKEGQRKSQQLSRSSSSASGKIRHQDLPKPDPTKIRTWTDRSGSFKVEAQFIDFHNGKLRLHKLNGVKIDVPIEKMCAEDARWVEHRVKNPRADEIAPAMPTRPPQPVVVQTVVAQPPPKKYNERWDWFDWFIMVGIPMQASLQYASAFKAEKLDDSDIQKLTHKQMKGLGLKEEHVRRIEKYVETGVPEEPEELQKKKEIEQSQIEKDEELARKLQKEWTTSGSPKTKSATNSRPKPSVSAPKDVHPDLLDFIGTQLTDKGKAKEIEAPKGDLLGFHDDAWAPRATNSPVAALSPAKVAPAPIVPVPTGPTPEQLQAIEAERRRIQEEEQIQKIQLLSLQKQTSEQKKQLEELQKLTQQQIELQKQIALQTGTQQQQHMLQIQAQKAQLQQAQLQQQLASQYPQLQMSYTNQFSQLNTQPTGFNNQQPTGFNLQQQTAFNNPQQTGFNSPTNNGRPRPQSSANIFSDPTFSQWQQSQQTGFQSNSLNQQQTGFQSNNTLNQQQTGFQSNNTLNQQQTGFQPTPQQTSQQQSAWQALQPQMTGFPPTTPSNGYQAPSHISTLTAGQQNVFNQPSGLQRSQTLGSQPTGRHWNNASPANPFGSPTVSPLQAQMTGVQFSTPSPQAFNQNPLQAQMTGYMQPQMTGFQPQQPPQGNSIFTPQGSLQYGQSAFSQRQW